MSPGAVGNLLLLAHASAPWLLLPCLFLAVLGLGQVVGRASPGERRSSGREVLWGIAGTLGLLVWGWIVLLQWERLASSGV